MLTTTHYNGFLRAGKVAHVLTGSLDVSVGGALVVATGHPPDRPLAPDGSDGVKRGEIVEFSAGSRRRLQALFCSMPPEAMSGSWFGRLSWDDTCIPDGLSAKRDLDVFSRRLARRWPDVCAIWRMELQDRKSGLHRGTVVPHLHLVVVAHDGVDFVDFYAWMVQAWHEVVASSNPLHSRAGIGSHLQVAYGSPRSLAWYASKYTSKRVAPEALAAFGWVGRWWGVLNRRMLPVAPRAAAVLRGREMVEFARLSRSWLRRWRSGRRYARVIARQPGLGFSLLGLPSEAAIRMVNHAITLAGRWVRVHVDLDTLTAEPVPRWGV